jgi:hypothetical protein
VPFAWRLSRYDPAVRDEAGSYRTETWTSIADVGHTFGGDELTLAEYEAVETAYVDALQAFADEAGIFELEVRGAEQLPPTVREGDRLALDQAVALVRAMLREEAVCKLESPEDDFYAHVGFDLYMYIGASRPCPAAVERAGELGLFVEPDWPSPQLPRDQE